MVRRSLVPLLVTLAAVLLLVLEAPWWLLVLVLVVGTVVDLWPRPAPDVQPATYRERVGSAERQDSDLRRLRPSG
jgi:hypothetical protein